VAARRALYQQRELLKSDPGALGAPTAGTWCLADTPELPVTYASTKYDDLGNLELRAKEHGRIDPTARTPASACAVQALPQPSLMWLA
jgi:hypothetical protein